MNLSGDRLDHLWRAGAMYFVVKKDGDVKEAGGLFVRLLHGIVMLGLFALNPNGINGAVMQMVSHGVYSGALFLLVGHHLRAPPHAQSKRQFGGLSHVMPGYAAVFLIMAMTAIGLPMLAGFYFRVSGDAGRVRSQSGLGRLGPDWELFERWLHALALRSACSLAKSKTRRTNCCRI